MGKKTITRDSRTGRFTLGRDRFDKISQVEGMGVSHEMKRDFREFDRASLPAEERRERIKRKYAKTRG